MQLASRERLFGQPCFLFLGAVTPYNMVRLAQPYHILYPSDRFPVSNHSLYLPQAANPGHFGQSIPKMLLTKKTDYHRTCGVGSCPHSMVIGLSSLRR